VNENVPLADGVPLITPVVELSVIPGGRLPALMDHVYGLCPPVALRGRDKAVPTTPGCNEDVVIEGAPRIWTVYAWSAKTFAVSRARTVKL
jgi:hypothetical protein